MTVNPTVAGGKPCIRDLRFPVSRLLGLLASGESREAILRAYPYLESADVDEALRYAACLAEGETIEFLKLDRTKREYDAKLAALRTAIKGGDTSGAAGQDSFSRVRRALNIPDN